MDISITRLVHQGSVECVWPTGGGLRVNKDSKAFHSNPYLGRPLGDSNACSKRLNPIDSISTRVRVENQASWLLILEAASSSRHLIKPWKLSLERRLRQFPKTMRYMHVFSIPCVIAKSAQSPAWVPNSLSGRWLSRQLASLGTKFPFWKVISREYDRITSKPDSSCLWRMTCRLVLKARTQRYKGALLPRVVLYPTLSKLWTFFYLHLLINNHYAAQTLPATYCLWGCACSWAYPEARRTTWKWLWGLQSQLSLQPRNIPRRTYDISPRSISTYW